MPSSPLSAGVYVSEVDLSQIIAAASTSIGAIVGATSKGPVDKPYLVTNTKAYTDRFGIPDPTLSWTAYQSIAFLAEAQTLYVQRVAGAGATYGGLLLTKPLAGTYTITNKLSEAAPLSVDFTTAGGYTSPENMAYFYYEGPGSYSSDIAIGITSLNLPVPFAPTLTQVITGGTLGAGTYSYSITAFNSIGETLASSSVVTTFVSGTTNSVIVSWAAVAGASGYKVYGRTAGAEGVLTVVGATTYSYTDTNVAVPSGSAPADYTLTSPVFSTTSTANTGGNLLGGVTYTYIITAVFSSGESPQSQAAQVVVPAGTTTNTVTLNWGAVAGASSYEIYGRVTGIGSQNFNLVTPAGVTTTTGSAAVTSAALFVGVTAGMTVSGAGIPVGTTVLSVTSTSAITLSQNATAISSVAVLTFAGYNTISTVGYIENAGAGTSYTDLGIVAPTFAPPLVNGYTTVFTVNVYELDFSAVNPVETYNCSMTPQLDAFGQQLEITQQINTNSTRIRVNSNAASMTTIPLVYSIPQTALSTGADGSAVTNSDVANGWTTNFNDKEAITIRLMMDGGYSNPVVHYAMDAVAQNRQDCVAILGIPTASQAVSAALDYRNVTLNLNSNRSALYTPDVYIQDNYNNRQVYVPPAGHVAAIYARTDRVSYPWRAPAGLNRGLLAVLGLRYIYNQGMRDLLAPAQISYMRNFPGNGIAVWEQITLQGKSSALSYVNVRRLFDVIHIAVEQYLLYSVFEPNDDFLRTSIVGGISQYLQTIKNARGLIDFLVVCDNSNNPAITTGQGQLNVDIYLTPTLPATKIVVQLVATQQGVSLTQLAASTGGQF